MKEEKMIANRLAQLRQKMKAHNIDMYLVLSDDFHGSEYVGDYFKCREFITGFTGSAGTALITQREARLFTDGRYFLQAEKQLRGSEIILIKQDTKGEPTIKQSVSELLTEGETLGFDGRTISMSMAKELSKVAEEKRGSICATVDLVGEIWAVRPSLPKAPVWELGIEYAGMARGDKLADIRKQMKEKQALNHLIASLEDIAWIFNLRGGDTKYCPVFLAYALISEQDTTLFVSRESFSDELTERLAAEGIELKDYQEVYEFVKNIKGKILLDDKRTNYALFESLGSESKMVFAANPSILLKAVKNETEIANIKKAHIKDGVAMVKFLYWLSQEIEEGTISEISAADKLEEFRQGDEDYLGQSFAPIMGYKEHGAIIHYSATKESSAALKAEGLLLMDTGGHYLCGSTDITRTISLGAVTKQQRKHYTAVLRGNINLAQARFKAGSVGSSLDELARGPIKALGLDYQHGTGHGVGYLLSIHEGPQSIRVVRDDVKEVPFEVGMITSNEPGVYLTEYGIRLENLTLCKRVEGSDSKELEFETLTMVPFDLSCIESVKLSQTDKQYLNKYHEKVREALSPYLTNEEGKWLSKNTYKV